jgi:hypothetical protein
MPMGRSSSCFEQGGTNMAYQKVLFPPGQVVATPGALNLGVDLLPYFWRHMTGDWGDLDEDDKHENEFAIQNGLRILSAYMTTAGKLWIITEADRSSTCMLLPEEY